jgi:riboflavin biosynthesis pyrimidine reductase
MQMRAGEDQGATAPDPLQLARLFPAEAPGTVAAIVEDLGLWSRREVAPERPRLLLNMISSVDGRATLGGRSGGLSDRADRALFHGLRGAVDAVLVGAGTVRAERYGRIIPDASRREQRRSRGLSDEPLACIISAQMTLDPAIPLLAEPAARVVMLTASQASLPATGAHVEYVRAQRNGQLDLTAALTELVRRFGIQTVLCEGGPHLCAQLLQAGLVDELFLSLSPQLVGDDGSGEALRIIAGAELEPPVALELLSVLSSGSELFLRYGVSARERVSRETTPSSSLAS